MPTLTRNQIKLAYTTEGQGTPVLLIHGLGSCKEDWQPQISALAEHYQVIALDLRGHGASSKPRRGYKLQRFSEDVLALMDALEIPQAHLIGLSLGGMITLQCAVDHPQRLLSAVVINATAAVPMDNWQVRQFFWMRLLAIRLRGVGYMAKLIAERNLPAPEHDKLRQRIAQQFARNDKNAYYQATRALMGWNVSDQLHRISCPLLAISSDQDYTPVIAKQMMVDAVANATLRVIDNARHLLPMEHPDEVNVALLDWLDAGHALR